MARMPKIEEVPLRDNSVGQGLLLATLALLAMGVVMVNSAMANISRSGEWYARVDFRHTMFAVAAGLVLMTAWRIDYRLFDRGGKLPVVAGVFLGLSMICCTLVFVPGVGKQVGGFYRWIRIGPPQYGLGFQPSELLKISLVIFLAAWLGRPEVNVRSFFKTFVPAMGLIGACAALVVSQDFGTAMIIGVSSCAVLLLAGVPIYYLLLLVPLAAGFVYKFVIQAPHRMARIEGFLNPWDIANPSTYQPRESLLAVITGGWTGKGLGNGVTKLGFLPEDSTDFIYAVFCEEWGVLGAVLLIGIWILWLWHARRAALRSQDGFGRLLAGSLGILVAVQAVLHIAVDLVAVPATGICLPFISAGGTSLVIMAGAAAVMISVTAHRYKDPQLDTDIGWDRPAAVPVSRIETAAKTIAT